MVLIMLPGVCGVMGVHGIEPAAVIPGVGGQKRRGLGMPLLPLPSCWKNMGEDTALVGAPSPVEVVEYRDVNDAFVPLRTSERKPAATLDGERNDMEGETRLPTPPAEGGGEVGVGGTDEYCWPLAEVVAVGGSW